MKDNRTGGEYNEKAKIHMDSSVVYGLYDPIDGSCDTEDTGKKHTCGSCGACESVRSRIQRIL